MNKKTVKEFLDDKTHSENEQMAAAAILETHDFRRGGYLHYAVVILSRIMPEDEAQEYIDMVADQITDLQCFADNKT